MKLENLSFTFVGRNHLINNISLTLNERKIYALIGTNGSGKTTLFNILSGFLKPHSGRILFKNKNIVGKEPYLINRLGIGRTFQDLRIINKLTVKENIILAMKNNPTDNWYKSIFPQYVYRNKLVVLDGIANNIINAYFLSDIKDSLANEISFGQQKLLTLACCIANGAELLLLDEPVAGINPEYADKISSLLIKLKEEGKTILFIEHNTDFISGTADHVYFLYQGKINEYDNIETMAADKYVKEAYL